MKLKDGFALRQMAGEFLAVPFDERYSDVGALVSLNETGAFLWEKLSGGAELDELVCALVGEYKISEDEAKAAVLSFTESLKSAGLLE